ncbi:MAG: ribokinase [Phycisphaerales bacterium]
MPPPAVCVVGSMNMDLVVRVGRLPAPGETLLGGSYKTFPGGKGANQAVAAARMGATVEMVGRVGDDAHGERLLSVLKECGVGCAHVVPTPGQPTGLGMITVADGGENTIVVASGANALVTVEDVLAAEGIIKASAALLLQLEIPLVANIEAAKIARAAGIPVILNAAPARQMPREFIGMVDVLLVNRSEAATLTGQDLGTEPGRLLLRAGEIGPATVILTLGAQGSIVSHRGRQRRIPTLQVTAVDSVGAGDAFSGAIACGWPMVHAAIKARSPEETPLVEKALLTASVAGALAATKAGAIPSLPTRAEVDEQLPRLEGMPRAI